MKKLILAFATMFVGAIFVVQFTRYSYTQASIVLEWVAVVSLVAFTLSSAWFFGKYVFSSQLKNEKSPELNSDAALEYGISKRELEVLVLIAEGFSNRQISEKLFVSESTIKKHASSIFAKLDVSRRTEAIKIAFQRKLISAHDFSNSE